MNRVMYYCPNILGDQSVDLTPPPQGGRGVLPEEESAHAVQVLRAKVGDAVDVTDGRGHLLHCVVTNPHRKHCEVQIQSIETPAPLHAGYVHIVLAPTKNIERTEWFLEKATEIGVDEITLVLCDHSERKVVNIERLQKIVVAAAKQSLRTTYPVLNDLTPFKEVVRSKNLTPSLEGRAGERLFIAHCEEGYAATENKRALRDWLEHGDRVMVLIGPEGDFSPAEIQSALAAGFLPVSLGNGRLRTETSGVVACHTAVLVNE